MQCLAGLGALAIVGCASVSLPPAMQGNVLNWHGVSTEWRGDTLHYWTGSAREGAGFNQPRPDYPVAASINAGSMTVTVRSASSAQDDDSITLAEVTASVLNHVARDIWPGEAIAARVDLYRSAADQEIGFHRPATWNPGERWEMSFVADDNAANVAQTIAHELYHLLIAAQRRGDPPAARIYEEVAARLYGGCGVLLAGQTFDFSDLPEVTITMPAAPGEPPRDFLPPFSDAEINVMVSRVDSAMVEGQTPPLTVHLAFVMTALVEVANGRRTIDPGTSEADRTITLCREVGGEPGALRDWFIEVSRDGRDARVVQ